MVHVFPAATLEQVSLSANGALAVTVRDSVLLLSLVTVKVFAALVWPMATEPNARDEGETEMGSTPVP